MGRVLRENTWALVIASVTLAGSIVSAVWVASAQTSTERARIDEHERRIGSMEDAIRDLAQVKNDVSYLRGQWDATQDRSRRR